MNLLPTRQFSHLNRDRLTSGGRVVSAMIDKAMKFLPRAITSLVIATALSGITFRVHAQIPKTIRDWARSDKLIEVNEQKTQVISLQPDQSLFFLSLGNSRFGSGDYVEAIADYTQALQLNPHNAAAYYNRGEVRSKLGDKNGAIADLKKAVDIFQSQGEQNNYQDALNHLKTLQNSLKKHSDSFVKGLGHLGKTSRVL